MSTGSSLNKHLEIQKTLAYGLHSTIFKEATRGSMFGSPGKSEDTIPHIQNWGSPLVVFGKRVSFDGGNEGKVEWSFTMSILMDE